MDKPFKTYEELLIKLRDEKKLTVPDEDRVIALLKQYSYFSLVSGCKKGSAGPVCGHGQL